MTSKVSARTSYAWVGSQVYFRSSEDVTLLEFTSLVAKSPSTGANVGSFIESKTSVVQTSNVGFTSEVPDYLVVHTGHGHSRAKQQLRTAGVSCVESLMENGFAFISA